MTVMCAKHHVDANLCGCDTQKQYEDAQAAGRARKARQQTYTLDELIARFKHARANGDPTKYLAGISVAEAHAAVEYLERLKELQQ